MAGGGTSRDRREPRTRGALRLAGWNALLLVVGVVLTAVAGEAYFRLTRPFNSTSQPWEFVPGVGAVRPPNTEVRHTNRLDFWTVSRTNSLGFLDREPPTPERAAATCHVSILGDSFVEAPEVPIEDKFQVRLEELAASRLPHLKITTSAFGIRNIGQVQQLPFYDEYARRLRPKLLVLVFVPNDFANNAPLTRALHIPSWPQRELPERTMRRRTDGKLELAWSRPKDRLPSKALPPLPPTISETLAEWAYRAMKKAFRRSWFALWLNARKKTLFPPDLDPRFVRHVEGLRQQPSYAALLEGWRPTTVLAMERVFERRDLPRFFEDALQYTRFALEQFKERAARDGAALVILASHEFKIDGRSRAFERLGEMAATLGVPVIDHADYILRQGAKPTDAQWPNDVHWNPAGHQWAAEALLEYIEQRPEICGG